MVDEIPAARSSPECKMSNQRCSSTVVLLIAQAQLTYRCIVLWKLPILPNPGRVCTLFLPFLSIFFVSQKRAQYGLDAQRDLRSRFFRKNLVPLQCRLTQG